MIFNKIVKLMFLLILFASCVSVKPVITTGDKSAGTVVAQWEGSEFTIVDSSTTREDARAACQAWKYKDARPFGYNEETGDLPIFSECASYSFWSGCTLYRYTVTYQCLD